MVSVTSARPSGGREAVPANTTSSILPPRRLLAPCSPITQAKASTMFDLPDPFGPTTQVIPGSNRSDVAEAKDLNPRRVRLFTYTRGLSLPVWSRPRPALSRPAGPPGRWGTQPTSLPRTLPRRARSTRDSRVCGPSCRAHQPLPPRWHSPLELRITPVQPHQTRQTGLGSLQARS